ncbi:MAG: sulfotransferase [Gemmatimonadota bacterium]|nr:sulfotransferase [Gemmatimonadota bacterium]
MSPEFLCIGAQKAGTTWLHHNLANHPQVWLPPVKELHYFDYPHRVPLICKVVGSSRHHHRAREGVRRLLSSITDSTLRNWHSRYLFHPRGDRWYVSLFSPAPDQIAGEVTPGYAALSDSGVAHVHTVLPELKIIFLLRNPIHRIWSAAAMHFSKHGHRSLNDVDPLQLESYFQRSGPQERSNYLRTLKTWEAYFEPRRIFVGFFDQLEQAPGSLLRDICEFLSIDGSTQRIPESASEKLNPRSYPQMPPEVSEFLTQRFSGQLQQLHQRFANEYTAAWLSSTQV